jgi:hypothetical protein
LVVVGVLGDGGAGAGFVDEGLPAVQAAMSAEIASRLTLRGLPRLAWWMSAMASSVNRGSARPASLTWWWT